MHFYISISLFSIIIILYWVISEVITIVFRFTGLPDEKARFQVVSLLTGCGFTTRESEMVLSTKERRHIARITMLFGYVFNITIVSILINIILSLKESQAEHYLHAWLIPLVPAVLLLVCMRMPSVRLRFDTNIEHLVGAIRNKKAGNTVLILDYIGQDIIAQVSLKTVPERLRNRTLLELDFRKNHKVTIMLVEHPGQEIEQAGPNTIFMDGDKLTVFGNPKAISKTFNAKERFMD